MKKNKIIITLCVTLIAISLVVSLFLDEGIGSRITQAVTVITAVIGAIALYIQFNTDRKINKASFLVEYNKSFFNDYKLNDVYRELNECEFTPGYKLDFDKFKPEILAYLEWIELIASMVERGVLDLYTMDNVLSFRFFVLVNNKEVQEREILPCAKYYRGTFYLFDKWYKFEKERNLYVPLEETALCKAPGYDEILKEVKRLVK